MVVGGVLGPKLHVCYSSNSRKSNEGQSNYGTYTSTMEYCMPAIDRTLSRSSAISPGEGHFREGLRELFRRRTQSFTKGGITGLIPTWIEFWDIIDKAWRTTLITARAPGIVCS